MEIPSWAWGVLGAAGTAVLGPLAVRLVAVLLDWNSRLLIKIFVNQGFKKLSLYTEVDEWRKSKRTFEDVGNDDWQKMARLKEALEAEGYIRLELTNKSKKRLSQLTICVHTFSPLIQINNGELVKAKPEEPIALGDLQPGRIVIVHFLMSSLFAVDSVRGIRRMFSVSADELGRVAYEYPLPSHFVQRRQNRRLAIAFYFGTLLMLLSAAAKPIAQLFGIVL